MSYMHATNIQSFMTKDEFDHLCSNPSTPSDYAKTFSLENITQLAMQMISLCGKYIHGSRDLELCVSTDGKMTHVTERKLTHLS